MEAFGLPTNGTLHATVERRFSGSAAMRDLERFRPLGHTPMRTQSCTLLAMPKTVPVREFRSHLADLLDEVADRREHVTITRHGRPSAVVIPINEYEALEETAEILSDDDTLAAIRRGLDDLAAGDEVALDEVRQEMGNRERA